MTPEEDWSGSKPSVEHFRVFGCLAYVHVPDSKRIKLDDKSMKCILLGVSEESKAYRLFDPVSKKIVISRDVIFEEDKAWDWSDNHQETIMANLEWEMNEKADPGNDNNVEESETDEPTLESEEPVHNDQTDTTAIEGRVRRPLVWM